MIILYLVAWHLISSPAFIPLSNSTTSCNVCHCDPVANQAALREMQRLLNIEVWDTLQPITSWQGVGVDPRGCVESLDFFGISIRLPDFLFEELTCLRSLKLASVFGPLPSAIKNLTYLEELDLSGSFVTGPLPAELGNLSNLKTLRAEFINFISGELPPEIGNLHNLQTLSLWGLSLQGTLPPSIGNLTQLETLFIAETFISGPIPKEIGKLTNLKELTISDNFFEGPLPVEIFNLNKLETLFIGEPKLSGSLPPQIGQLNSLRELSISFGGTSGPIPPAIRFLSNLETCTLSRNQLSGEIGSAFEGLHNLTRLSLGYNQLSGELPAYFSDLTSLEVLRLNDNQFAGKIPKLGQLKNLTQAYLINNRFDSLPPLLQDISRSISVGISNNFLSFDDIIPNLDGTNQLSYSPQRPFLEHTTMIFSPCQIPIINLNIDRGIADNEYIWEKNGEIVYSSRQNYFSLDSAFQDPKLYPGEYTCQISNPAVPDLVLRAGPIRVEISESVPIVPDTIFIEKTLCYGESLQPGIIKFDCSRPTGQDLVFDPETGCPTLFEVRLTCEPCQIVDSKDFIITPNGDGVNEKFILSELLENPEQFPNNKLSIYDRNHRLLFQQSNYNNEWSGVDMAGQPLPLGTYYYQFSYGRHLPQWGTITIVR